MICIFIIVYSILVIEGNIRNINEENSINERVSRAIIKNSQPLWKKFPIKYFVGQGLNGHNIISSFKDIESQTCLKFKKVSFLTEEGIIFKKRIHKCNTKIRRKFSNKPHIVYLCDKCLTKSKIQKMILLALGVIYEVTRPDRDNYVTIKDTDIHQHFGELLKKFSPEHATTYDLPYDYNSLMHMSYLEMVFYGGPFIKTNQKLYQTLIGSATKLSFNDFKLLNKHYCKKSCGRVKKTCFNNGYQNPKSCNKCKCPKYYRGINCKEYIESKSKKCENDVIFATDVKRTISIKTDNECYYRIIARKGYKIQLTLKEKFKKKHLICCGQEGVEIRYLKNKSVSGIFTCGIAKNEVIESEDNLILMHHRKQNLKYDSDIDEKRLPYEINIEVQEIF